MLLNRTTEELARDPMPKFQQQCSEEETAGLLCFGSQCGHLKQERDCFISLTRGKEEQDGIDKDGCHSSFKSDKKVYQNQLGSRLMSLMSSRGVPPPRGFYPFSLGVCWQSACLPC